MISERKNSNRPLLFPPSASIYFMCQPNSMIGSIFCEHHEAKIFLSPCVPTDTSSATKMLSCDRESFSGVLSVKSARPALTRTKTNPSLSNLLFTAHLPTEAFCVRCVLAEKRAVAQTSDRAKKKRGQSGRRIFPAGCIPHVFIWKTLLFWKILCKFGAVHSTSIVFSFSLCRGAKSSFCAAAIVCALVFIYICIQKLFMNIFYLLNPIPSGTRTAGEYSV